MLQIYVKEMDKVWFAATLKDKAIYATTFTFSEKEAMKHMLANIPYNETFEAIEKPSKEAERLLETLKAIYDGGNADLNFKLDMSWLSGYSQKILNATFKIPVGYVTFYGLLAKTVGGSPRAVGRVMATNPFPPIVPCHRVVKTDFTLGGYGGGLKLKWEFLQRENRGYKQPKTIRIDDRDLRLFPVSHVKKSY